MILEFTTKNYRSIKDNMVFSLEGESGQAKPENTFEVILPNNQKKKLLKSAVMYGANASGKTNFIRGVWTLTNFIRTSLLLSADQVIEFYEPYLFNTDTEQAPTEFTITFLLPEGEIYIIYKYEVIFNREEVLFEELTYYPKGQSHNLFTRTNERTNKSEVIHTGKLGKSLSYREIDLFRNQLLLSKFGKDIPLDILTNVYLYFNTIEVWNALDVIKIGQLRAEIAHELFLPENKKLLARLNKLIRIADTKIDAISIQEPDKAMEGLPYRPYRRSEEVFAQHAVYSGDKIIKTRSLSLSEESAGTNVLFALGGIILKRLELGGVLFFDELDNSLHPKLSKFLVRLFNNPISNPHSAQLIVATHEVTLLDKEVFRKDQIWFAEKNRKGETEYFCVKDFEGVRDNTPFDKWYLNGKFGGQPKIREIEFIFSHD